MSVYENDVLAENLFEKLESVSGYMNLHDYAEKQSKLLRLIMSNDLEAARDFVENVYSEYAPPARSIGDNFQREFL